MAAESRAPATPARSATKRLQAGIRALCLIACFALVPATHAATAAAPPARGADLDVALFTFGPGTEVWERFGHNAIEIRNRVSGVARLYNYGMFDFAQKNFYLNFARGRMRYRIDVEDPDLALPYYFAEGRWVVEQKLDLTPAQRADLADYLAWNARPENAQYRYDYYTANCATRVRDALNRVLGDAIHRQLSQHQSGVSYRDETLRLMRPEPLLMLGMDAGLGPFADRELSWWDASFVPMRFMQYVRDMRVRAADGTLQPLVTSERLLNPGRLPRAPRAPPHWFWPALGIGLALALGLFGMFRARRRTWTRIGFAGAAATIALICGIAGIVLLGLWTLTDHVAAWHNENLLLLDPLCLLLLPTLLTSVRNNWQPSRFARRTAVAIALLGCIALVLHFAPTLAQSNGIWIALLLPIHLALALAIVCADTHIAAS